MVFGDGAVIVIARGFKEESGFGVNRGQGDSKISAPGPRHEAFHLGLLVKGFREPAQRFEALGAVERSLPLFKFSLGAGDVFIERSGGSGEGGFDNKVESGVGHGYVEMGCGSADGDIIKRRDTIG